MAEKSISASRKRYGLFTLAATAYIAGGLLFSFWSYCAHRDALISYTDKTLLETSMAFQEILALETETPGLTAKKSQRKRLMPLARHGNSSCLSVVDVNDGHFTVVISVASQSNPGTELTEAGPPPPELLKILVSITNEQADTNQVLTTVEHPSGSLRYAVLYKADRPGKGTAYLVAKENRTLEQQLANQALRLSAAGLGMVGLAIPLILLFSRSRKRASTELSLMNTRLQHDVEIQKIREAELKDAIADLERFNAVTAGRESRIIELKVEVNELLRQQNKKPRYNIKNAD